MKEQKTTYTFTEPPVYTWECDLFGHKGTGITWKVKTPPCWFWRKMQYIFFGNIWKKII